MIDFFRVTPQAAPQLARRPLRETLLLPGSSSMVLAMLPHKMFIGFPPHASKDDLHRERLDSPDIRSQSESQKVFFLSSRVRGICGLNAQVSGGSFAKDPAPCVLTSYSNTAGPVFDRFLAVVKLKLAPFVYISLLFFPPYSGLLYK